MTCAEIFAELKTLSEEKLCERVKAEGFPTNNAFAEALWHLLSSNKVWPYSRSVEIYQRLGYVPMVGFPLQIVTQRHPAECTKTGEKLLEQLFGK